MLKDVKIRTKLTSIILIIVLISIFVVSFFIFFNIKKILINQALNEENHDVAMYKNEIDSFLVNVKRDLLFLSNSSNIQRLINSTDEENLSLYKKQVQEDFFEFSTESNIYYQIRYLNEDGAEIVRVDNIDQNINIVPENNLQNKKGRYYFEDTMKAKEGIVYVSPLDLNIENAEIENRGTSVVPEYVPVIRYGTPVFDESNNPKGIVILNIYADNFLDKLDKVNIGQTDSKEVFLINKDGYYLHHPDKSKEWGFMFDNDEQVQNYCEQSNKFFSNERGQFFSDKDDCFISFAKVFPSGDGYLSSNGSNKAYASSTTEIQGKDYYWIIISKVNQNEIFNEIQNLINKMMVIIVIIIMIISLIVFMVVKSLSKPINELKKGTKIIKNGKLGYTINIDRKDEIGDLAKSINSMSRQLEESQNKVEKKVADRTKDLEELNKLMIGRELKMVDLKKEIIEMKNKLKE